jgi:hypothetical protein
MEPHQTRNPPPAPLQAPAAPVNPPLRAAPRPQWTPAKQRIFLAALLETGSVAHAAGAAGMSRSSAHRLRRRLAGTKFDRTWDFVLVEYARRMCDPFGAQAAQP